MSSREFLAENNACGQNLLNIVATGNSIIAELLRLKDYIPDIYWLATKDLQDKYKEVILDFKYFSITEAQEEKIESQVELQDLDSEICENYLELVTRFYLAFESSHQYAADLKHFIDELNSGYYIQQSLESVLQDEEGKQLICESLYIFGVILLIMDFHIPGAVRERLLISYYRYSGAKSHGDSDIEDVCMLLRTTGFISENHSKHNENIPNNSAVEIPPNYPEAYFARFTFDETFIDMVLARLRCDDIYNQMSIYPHPDHRSTALSNQAAMLFVCLYFKPKILHQQVAQMREIVDKFFLDNWIVSIYMGLTVNLVDAWHQFKAAKSAISPVVEAATVKGLCEYQRDLMQKTLTNTRNILRDGVINDYFVLQRIQKILNLIRGCNVLLRWYFLHASAAVLEFSHFGKTPQTGMTPKDLRELVCTELQYKHEEVLRLLLDCSQLELTVKELLRNLMNEKVERYAKARQEAVERIQELGEAFSGTRALSRIEPNAQLHQWFLDIATQIEELSVDKPNMSGRVLIQLIQALEEVEEFHNLRANMHVKQYLLETREFLHKMMQIINVKEDLLIKLQLISDLSYAWHLIDREFTAIMQENIKKQPKSVIRLRAALLKLSSALEIPLLRINQAKSEDLVSVSNYYSTELANYMRKVLQIIPATMFSLLARIIELQTKELKPVPARIEKEKLKDYAQFDQRYEVAKLTHSIAVFTEGILMMKKTLVGVLELDPKQLLEDGIRKELVRHLALSFHGGLAFMSPKQRAKVKQYSQRQELETNLEELAHTMDGYRRSFAYIQDYLSIHGLKILQQEMTRVINFNVEQECNAFLRNKVQHWQSKYQNSTIPVPSFGISQNFIGRLAQQLLECTQPLLTFYVPLKGAWYERQAPHNLVLGIEFFEKLREAMAPVGLVGLDCLYAHMFAKELKENLDKIQHNLLHDEMWMSALNKLSAELDAGNFPWEGERNFAAKSEASSRISDPIKYFAQYHERWLKVWPILCNWLLDLGHKLLLRERMANELQRSSKIHCKDLHNSLVTFNKAILFELRTKAANDEKSSEQRKAELDEQIKILTKLRSYLQYQGIHQPAEQIYAPTKNTPHLPLFLCLFTIAHVGRFSYNLPLPKQSKHLIDANVLLSGLCSLLQQFNVEVKLIYVAHLCQYVNAVIEHNLRSKNELSTDAMQMLEFLEIFADEAKLSRSELEKHLSKIILSQWQYMGPASKT